MCYFGWVMLCLLKLHLFINYYAIFYDWTFLSRFCSFSVECFSPQLRMKNLVLIFSTVSDAPPGVSADNLQFAVPKRHGITCSLVWIHYKNKISFAWEISYQYNTGSPRSPISQGSFDPKCLDGRSSTNFFSQQELRTSSKSLRDVNYSCTIFVVISYHMKKNDDSPVTSVRFLCFWGCSSFDPMFFARLSYK